MKPMSKNGSSTGTAPKKASRRPRWLGPLLEDPMYRRMRKALIREIAPDTALDWVEAEECVMSQYQSMRFGDWQKVICEHCQWDGIKRAVKRRLRRRCPSDPEDELDRKGWRPRAGRRPLRCSVRTRRTGLRYSPAPGPSLCHRSVPPA